MRHDAGPQQLRGPMVALFSFQPRAPALWILRNVLEESRFDRQ